MTPTKEPGKHAPTSASADGQFGLHTVVTAVRCWWWLAAPVGLLLAVAAGVTVWLVVPLKYTASAWLIIRERPAHLLKPLVMEDSQRFVQNQLELMRSPSVIEPVIALPEVASTPEIAKQEASNRDPAKALKELATIRAVGKSEFYVVEFTSTNPKKAAIVANALANQFLQLQIHDESEQSSRTLTLLKQRLAEQELSVKTLRERVQTLAIERTGKNPFDTESRENQLPTRSPFADLQSQLTDAEVEVAVLEAQVQAETELLAKLPNEVPQRDVERFIAEHPRVAGPRALLEQDLAKLQEHERNSNNLERNVLYQQLKKKVAADQVALQKVVAEIEISAKDELLKQVRMAREDEVNALRRRHANMQLTKQILSEKFDEAFKNQKEFTGDTLQLEFLRADYERASAVHQAISERILAIETEMKAPQRVVKHRDADVPEYPDEAAPYKKILMASFGAFLLPFGLAIGLEHLYRRVSNRNQLEFAGGIGVVGEITVLPTRKSATDRSRRAHRELQLYQETVDGLRTVLAVNQSLKGVKMLAVTSAVSREGKTNLGVQLALSVAKATGERTLLIDGDMRSPDLHRIFDVDRSPGLAELLEGRCSIEEAIKTVPGQSIQLLTAGRLSCSPHRLVGKGNFESLVVELRKSYAHIILDTPPILAASEVLVMAQAADVTLVCVRRDFSRVKQVTEAYGRLQNAGVKTAGAVLGGIPPREYTSRYGSYYESDHFIDEGADVEELEA